MHIESAIRQGLVTREPTDDRVGWEKAMQSFVDGDTYHEGRDVIWQSNDGSVSFKIGEL